VKIAVLSDIHANVVALKKVMKYLKSSGVTKIYSLGDIIGYGNHPNEVIGLLNRKNVRCIKGNHEQLFLNGIYLKKYNLLFTKRVITKKSLNYLKKLPEKIIIKDANAILTHTVPFASDNYVYANSSFVRFKRIKHKFIVLGHTHYPMYVSYQEKKILNPGSVGQPRDGIEKPSFLICDFQKGIFEFIRI